jgi:hypothetical protein
MSHTRISRTIAFAALVVCLMLILPAPASARVGVGIGFYGGYYPYYWGPWGYPYYAYYGAPYGYAPYGNPLGEVHIKSPDPNAQIYINGSLAGRAHELKRFYLAPGTYNIEQRIGNDVQKERLYVLASRKVTVEFGAPGTASSPPAAPRPEARPQPGPPPTPAPDVDAPPPPAPAPAPETPRQQ